MESIIGSYIGAISVVALVLLICLIAIGRLLFGWMFHTTDIQKQNDEIIKILKRIEKRLPKAQEEETAEPLGNP